MSTPLPRSARRLPRQAKLLLVERMRLVGRRDGGQYYRDFIHSNGLVTIEQLVEALRDDMPNLR